MANVNLVESNDISITQTDSDITLELKNTTLNNKIDTRISLEKDYQDYTLTIPNTLTGTATCESKFGIACFTMGIRSTSSNIPAYTAIAEGVPAPKRVVNFCAVNGTGSTIRMQLSTDGKVYCANEMTNASNYLGTCTYVIDE